MISRLRATNFTVFKHLNLEFSPGINVLIGTNGTGKTQLLKLLYRFHTAEDKKKGSLSQRGVAQKEIVWGTLDKSEEKSYSAVYIPTKEPLSFAPGFLSLDAKYQMAFERAYADTLKLAYLPLLKKFPDESRRILDEISKEIGGEVVVEGETFFLKQKNSKMEMCLVAEGHRKLALLWQLIRNGSIEKGTVLYWDEPEANLHPQVSIALADLLFDLSQNGVQIFTATHCFYFLSRIGQRALESGQASLINLRKSDYGVTASVHDLCDEMPDNDIFTQSEYLLTEAIRLDWEE